MSLVIDSSVALCWLMPDEQASEAEAAIRAALTVGAHAPPLFLLEVSNVLLVNVRRKRISMAAAEAGLAAIRAVSLQRDDGAAGDRLAEVFALADRHGLTTYDAAYLELARRLDLPLATLDKRLRGAATAEGVPIFGP